VAPIYRLVLMVDGNKAQKPNRSRRCRSSVSMRRAGAVTRRRLLGPACLQDTGMGGPDLHATSIEQSAERGGLHVPKCRTPGCPNEASEGVAYCDGCLQSRQPPSPPVQPPPVKRPPYVP
jgi:hypothetical protein